MDERREVVVTGHVFVVQRSGGRQWYVKWRDGEGQHQKRLGPAWVKQSGSDARGRPRWRTADGTKPEGYLSPRDAAAALEEIKRTAPREVIVRRGREMTFGEAAEAWLEHGRHKRGLKRSTLHDYRLTLNCYLLRALGDTPLAKLSVAQLRAWYDPLPHGRTTEKSLMVVRAILNHAVREEWIAINAAMALQRHPVRYSGDYDYYSRSEIDEIVACAASEQDATIYATAALTGLRRGELLALRWRDVDFAGEAIRVRSNLSFGELTTPKSGRVRVVPLVPEAAQRLARLSQRELFTDEHDPAFVNETGGHLDPSALRRRYVIAVEKAGLRVLPFHSLRHFFGSMAVNHASLIQVQAWMGHAHLQTTARYLHAKRQQDDARLLARAFAPQAAHAPKPLPALTESA